MYTFQGESSLTAVVFGKLWPLKIIWGVQAFLLPARIDIMKCTLRSLGGFGTLLPIHLGRIECKKYLTYDTIWVVLATTNFLKIYYT